MVPASETFFGLIFAAHKKPHGRLILAEGRLPSGLCEGPLARKSPLKFNKIETSNESVLTGPHIHPSGRALKLDLLGEQRHNPAPVLFRRRAGLGEYFGETPSLYLG